MPLGRILVEEFQPDVLKWLRQKVELVVVNPWVEPERWELEASRVDAVISRKGKITREQMQRAPAVSRSLPEPASASIRQESISTAQKNSKSG